KAGSRGDAEGAENGEVREERRGHPRRPALPMSCRDVPRGRTFARTRRPSIRIKCFGKTDVGRKRELNEDSLHFSDKDGTCLLADGMGGRDFGEVASSLCVSTLNSHLHKFFPKSLEARKLADGGPLVDVIVQT